IVARRAIGGTGGAGYLVVPGRYVVKGRSIGSGVRGQRIKGWIDVSQSSAGGQLLFNDRQNTGKTRRCEGGSTGNGEIFVLGGGRIQRAKAGRLATGDVGPAIRRLLHLGAVKQSVVVGRSG